MEETKLCAYCKQDKHLSEFKIKRNGHTHSYCNYCRNFATRLYHAAHKEERRLKDKANESLKEKNALYRATHKKLYNGYWSNYYKNNKDKIQLYYKKNAEKVSAYRKSYRQRRKHELNIYFKAKRDSDPQYNISVKIRNRINIALRNNRILEKESSIKLLGCNYSFLDKYIKSLFAGGMTMTALLKGEIHIDHIRPCASFDLTDIEQQKLCFHYTNLQPLWAKDNQSKGSMFKGKRYSRKAS